MSDFFTPPPRPEPEPVERQPPWLGPPTNELGVPVPLRALLARTENVAVALLDVSAYSTGLEFRLEVRLRAHATSSPIRSECACGSICAAASSRTRCSGSASSSPTAAA